MGISLFPVVQRRCWRRFLGVCLLAITLASLTIAGGAAADRREGRTAGVTPEAGQGVYLPVVSGGLSQALTGLRVTNSGVGSVAIRLSGGLLREFEGGTRWAWWFPLDETPTTITAYSSTGPCAPLVAFGGNTYDIPIDFRLGELRRISFICLDVGRPPQGIDWQLSYYLEPLPAR